jgi:hypothetical protein
MAKKDVKSGLGKGFSELLDDNSEITNMKSNVLLHKEDGRSVKIYDKTGGERAGNKAPTPIVIKTK